MKHSTACRGNAAMDATLVNGFASDASVSVDIKVADSFCISIGYPGHFSLAGSHIGGGYINTRSLKKMIMFFPPILPYKILFLSCASKNYSK